MPLDVFGVVILAAVAHASWNALLKAAPDQRGMFKVMFSAQIVVALAILPFVPFPSVASLPYLAASATIGVGAMFLLSYAYRLGDLSQAYPLSRGSAPLFVALISTVVLGVELAPASLAGIVLIGIGVTSLSLRRGMGGWQNGPLIMVALANGMIIALCSLLDGYGARLSGSTHGYVATLALALSSLMVITMRFTRRGTATPLSSHTIRMGLLAGILSLASVWLVIWAMTQVSIPLVSALRESSIVFATAIGIYFFKEIPGALRLLSIAIVLVGMTILRLGG